MGLISSSDQGCSSANYYNVQNYKIYNITTAYKSLCCLDLKCAEAQWRSPIQVSHSLQYQAWVPIKNSKPIKYISNTLNMSIILNLLIWW